MQPPFDANAESLMLLALEQARAAFAEGEVPVGALVALEGRVIASGYNKVERLKDPTAHAEVEALRNACRALGSWRLTGAHLYTTLEPCAMCLGAIINSRCAAVTWAAPDIRQGASGSWCNLLANRHPISNPQVNCGYLEAESAALLREFFRLQRQKKG